MEELLLLFIAQVTCSGPCGETAGHIGSTGIGCGTNAAQSAVAESNTAGNDQTGSTLDEAAAGHIVQLIFGQLSADRKPPRR